MCQKLSISPIAPENGIHHFVVLILFDDLQKLYLKNDAQSFANSSNNFGFSFTEVAALNIWNKI